MIRYGEKLAIEVNDEFKWDCLTFPQVSLNVAEMPRTRSALGVDLKGKGERIHSKLIGMSLVPANSALRWVFRPVQRDSYSRPITLDAPPLPVGFRIVPIEDGVVKEDQTCYAGCIHSCEHFCEKCLVRPGDLLCVDGQARIHTRCACIMWHHDPVVVGGEDEFVCPRADLHLVESSRYRRCLGSP